MVKYFQVDLAYFNCETKVECQAYLAKYAAQHELDEIKLRAKGMSEAGLAALRTMMDFVRKAEGLPPVETSEE